MYIKKLGPRYSWELQHHRENTLTTHIKTYTASQLAFIDGVSMEQVKKSGKYLPVRIDNSDCTYDYRARRRKSPYGTHYIRLDEIKFIFMKRNKGKYLTIENL